MYYSTNHAAKARAAKMSTRGVPKCVECRKTDSLLWRPVEKGQICQECYEENKDKVEEAIQESLKGNGDRPKDVKENDAKDTATEGKPTAAEEKRLRKSTRATRLKAKVAAAAATAATSNGGKDNAATNKATHRRNRRNIFKKPPFKMPVVQATTHTVDSTFYKGYYVQVGDIVSLVDHEDNVYYAQIRGLLMDNYCERSAFLTWLIPTQDSPDPKDGFEPATYLIGPDEEFSRKLSCLEFVMHAPSSYYLDRSTPFPLPEAMEQDTKPGGYIWTNLPSYRRDRPVLSD